MTDPRVSMRRIANSPYRLMALFLATVALASLCYAFLEGAPLGDSVYWAVVTMTTLGYGDLSPSTGVGKTMTGGLITFTVFILIPTITANVSAWLIVNRDTFTDDEQEAIKESLARIERQTRENVR